MIATIYSVLRGIFCCPRGKHRMEVVAEREDFALYIKTTVKNCKDCTHVSTHDGLLKGGP